MKSDFERTGVFCSDKETKEIAELALDASTAPVMLVGGSDLSQIAWGRLHIRVDELAVTHGLPALDGEHYGFDATKREFLRVR